MAHYLSPRFGIVDELMTWKNKAAAVYSVGELAEMIGEHPATIYRIIKSDPLPGQINFGGRIFFSKNKINNWLGVNGD